jgi:hypothetical protein
MEIRNFPQGDRTGDLISIIQHGNFAITLKQRPDVKDACKNSTGAFRKTQLPLHAFLKSSLLQFHIPLCDKYLLDFVN